MNIKRVNIMKNACKTCIDSVQQLVFPDKFLIEKVGCSVIVRISERFYNQEIKQRFPVDAEESNRLYEMKDSDHLRLPVWLVFYQLRRSMEIGVTSEMYYEGKVLELLFLFQNGLSMLTMHKTKLSPDDLKAVHTVREIIDMQFCRCPKIAELAIITNTSPTKLQRDFKATFGRTIHSYLSETRMAKALEMLDQLDKTVSVVAKTVGYMKPGRFSEIFKQTYGLTPSEYRRRQN